MLEHLGISDPGEEIVEKAIENGIQIVPIPGACALIHALVASGLSTREFLFLGFLSTNHKEKRDKLDEIKYETRTLVLYEAPHRLQQTLSQILEILGNRQIVLARELTKMHEEYIRGTCLELVEKMQNPKGEFVVLVKGAEKSKQQIEIEDLSGLSLEEHYAYYEEKGMVKKEIIKQIAKDRKVSKNEIYQHFVYHEG